MKVSLNTVKQYIQFDLPSVDELVTRINQQLGGVEEVIDLGKKYQGIVIVRVVECAPLEGSDHLNVTKVDDGGVVDDVERDENGLVQVVCGATNVHAGMFAVWLSPGVTVPESYDDAEPFVLGARPLRGVMSNGMLASPKELAFGDAHEGILEIDPNEWTPSQAEIKPGANFAEAYGLNDHIIDIENKMFTHRPDCFGQFGVMREIAGILGQHFESPEWYKNLPEFGSGDGLQLSVENSLTDKVPRFMAVAIKNVEIKQSPVWLQAELVRLGSKPINNIVDVTNYIMLLTAQPMHAYDYDKVATGKLGVRLAQDGEKLTLLGSKSIDLNPEDIVITDGEKPIGLAGIMGGADTEVSSETKNIILECANFDMYTIRRTSMRHGLFTDAASRFTKGQSPLQNPYILGFALMSVFDVTVGEQASHVIDSCHAQTADDGSLHGRQTTRTDFINQRLGLSLSAAEITILLTNVEFAASATDDSIEYIAPFWRTDVEIAEDVVEEVGRLYGFDNLPQELPTRSLKPAPINRERQLKYSLRDTLSRAGANEVLTYSFVHKSVLEKAGQDVGDAYQLSNALSPDLHYFRMSVLPSLLDKVHANVRAGYDKFALFEIGKGHRKSAGNNDEGVPVEQQYVALTTAHGGFYQAKVLLEFVAQSLNLKFEYQSLGVNTMFEPKRAAVVRYGDETIGVIGEYRAVVRRGFKLPDDAAGFEIDFEKLQYAADCARVSYTPLSRFPSAERDITFRVGAEVTYASVEGFVKDALAQTSLDSVVSPISIYKPDDDQSKNITLRINLTAHDKTLEGPAVAAVMEDIASIVTQNLGAVVV